MGRIGLMDGGDGIAACGGMADETGGRGPPYAADEALLNAGAWLKVLK